LTTTPITSGGTVTISGLDQGAVISSGGTAIITAGGTEVGATVSAGGTVLVESGGVLINSFINAGGTAQISGGVASGSVVAGANAYQVIVAGSSFETVVNSGGAEIIYSGALSVDATINSGGEGYNYGVMLSSIVNNGGSEYAQGGGVISAGTIAFGGSVYADFLGGSDYGSLIESGGILELAPAASGGAETVQDGGIILVDRGGTDTAPVIAPSGFLVAYPGAIVTSPSGPVISSGAIILAGPGQTYIQPTNATTLTGFQEELLFSGGVATNVTLSSGGWQFVDGGTASGTTVDWGGHLIVSAGAVYGAKVNSGGGVSLTSGAIADGIQLGTSGFAFIGRGATAFYTTVGAGAVFDVLGSAYDSVISGGTEFLNFSQLAAGTVEFAGSGSVLIVETAGQPSFTISGFASGDKIELPLYRYYADDTAYVSGSTLFEGGSHGYFRLADVGEDGLSLAVTPDAAIEGIDITALCFAAGACIATPAGARLIETLAPGDLVFTVDGRAEKILWIGQRSYDGRFIAGNNFALPIRIAAHAIAPNIPARALTVSPGHGIWIDGALIPAWRLVNGVSITQADAVDSITYFHIELDSHALLLAENCPAESFLDIGLESRGIFQNMPPAHRPSPTPLPRLESGFELAKIQRRLSRRAGLTPAVETPGAWHGHIDSLRGPITGWAQYVEAPEIPVTLIIRAGGIYAGHILANEFRADLKIFGSGCHAFTFTLPPGCTGPITIHRALDGAPLAGDTIFRNKNKKIA
jgi:autotransporter passenger strand-loop-strand repeat protein